MATFNQPGDLVTVRIGATEDAPGGVRSYDLRVPLIADKLKIRRAVHAKGGRNPTDVETLDALRADVLEMIEQTGDAEAWNKTLEAIEARVSALREWLADYNAGAYDTSALDDVAAREVRERMVAEMNVAYNVEADCLNVAARVFVGVDASRYADAAGDAAVYHSIVGDQGARVLLVAWRGILGVEDWAGKKISGAQMEKIPFDDLAAIGRRVDALFGPGGSEEKN